VAGLLRRQALTELCRNWASVIAAAVYVPLLDGRPVAEPGAADRVAGAALADVVADLAALHGTIEQMGALLIPNTEEEECVGVGHASSADLETP